MIEVEVEVIVVVAVVVVVFIVVVVVIKVVMIVEDATDSTRHNYWSSRLDSTRLDLFGSTRLGSDEPI